jgi:limonene-1,2-epoxide hydrolase
MRKTLMTGVLGLMGLAAPTGALAAMSGAATTATASVAPAVANVAAVGGTVMPGITHEPLLGKHLLSVSLHGVRQTTNVQSANWAGYADINDTFQTLSSSWVQPTANCAPTHGGLLGLGATHAAYSSFWVGLDGYTSSSVEQTGTDTDCGSNGAPIYYAWYEMYPASSVQLSSAQYPVSPGDTMTAMVMSNTAGTSYNLAIKDATKGWTFSVPETSAGFPRSSAEVVAEAPSQCTLIFCSELPLANFGTVNFTNAVVADTAGHVGNIATFANADMQMAQNGTILATPGPLTGGGSSFSVTWNS